MHAASPVRTLTLTERVPRVCRLPPGDVEFLVTEQAGRFELTPTGTRNRYRLTSLGHVGVVVAPTCRLVIRPKLPLRNFLFLLDPATPPPAAPDSAATTPAAELLDLLAGQLAHRLSERTAAGLHRSYAERSAQGPFLQGRLDVVTQLRESPGRKDQLHSQYEDLTADVPCNQVPRAVAERVLACPLLDDEPRAALRRALQGFEGVRPVPAGPDSFTPPALDRLPPDYRPLFELCRLLAEGLAPGDAAGPTPAPAFLLDMERLFERYVTGGIVRAFAASRRCTVSVQVTHAVSTPAAGQPEITMRPDLTIDRDGRPVLVVDAKWKRLPKTALLTDDLYQVLGYATALGARSAVLVYPGRRDRVWAYPLAHAPIQIDVRTLRVTAAPDACTRSLRRLGRALRRESRS